MYTTWESVPCKDHGRHGDKQRYASCYHEGVYIDQHVRALLASGPRPDGARARHLCDNKRCIEGAHLVWGSQADNIRDTEGKPGSRVTTRVLSDQEVAAVREATGTQLEIACLFGVSRMAVQQIRAGTRRS